MGTPDFAVHSLDAIHRAGHEILLVVSQEDKPKGRGKKLAMTPVKERALQLGLEVFQPRKIKDVEAVNRLKSLNPDVIVVTAYGQLLSKEILDIPKKGCINVHASLLPKYRGAAPINFALINGESVTGITTQLMEIGLDTGDMLVKDQLEIAKEDTAITLFEKLAVLSEKTITKTLELVENNELKPEPQKDEDASYVTMMNKELGHIDWSKSAQEIVNLWRGTEPWPGVFGIYKEQVVKFADIKADEAVFGKIGEIVNVGADYIQVATGDGSVKIYSVQFPNKKRMLVSEYLKGNNVEKSSIIS